MPAGYSGTPLLKKLGIKEGTTVFAPQAPADYLSMLGSLPAGARLVRRLSASVDLVHLFRVQRDALAKDLMSLRRTVRPDAAVWVSWPKKSSKVPTTITEDVIRELCLPLGFVDIKVCAVDDTWSGLKLVIRKELRQR
jgi:hypothetical protein